MTDKEKANAYDEALERAKKVHKYSSDIAEIKRMEEIFPVLKESEDEEIRKWIIDDIRYNMNNEPLNNSEYKKKAEKAIDWLEKQGNNLIENGYTNNKDVIKYADNYSHAIWYKLMDNFKNIKDYHIGCNDVSDIVLNAIIDTYNWLEKQDKQKPADKIEPKFHEGDWITFTRKDGTREVLQVSDIIDGRYYFNHLLQFSWSIKECNEKCHSWTIQDAKDGDVLFAENFDNIGGCVFLFKGLDSWRFDAEGDRAIATGYCCTSITESGSTDFGIQGPDCVEIKRVHPATKEQRDLLFQKMYEAGYTFDFEKKELKKLKFKVGDEVITENEESLTITRIDKEGYWSNDLFICNFDNECIWDLVEQKPVEWTEEDEETLDSILNDIKQNVIPDEDDVQWLKLLKGRMRPCQKWSEEDESMYTRTLGILGKCYMGQLPTKVEDELKWLKSRLKYFRPQRQWKPSDAQMQALKEACDKRWEPDGLDPLYTLYEQLKKL